MISVDRIEGDLAVCETENGFINIPLKQISGSVKDGALLKRSGEKYIVDTYATDERRKMLFEKQKNLFNK